MSRSLLIFISLLLYVALFAWWDIMRVERDFHNLMKILQNTRTDAIYGPHDLLVKFADDKVLVTEMDTGSKRLEYTLPTLHRVNYDTTLGKGMIAFTSSGTDPYNIREHGGDITLRSWLGVERNIWVNCTGFPKEGVLVDDVLKAR